MKYQAFLLTIITLFVSHPLFPQESTDFGDISRELLEQEAYPHDPEAQAAIIMDKQITRIQLNEGAELVTYHHRIIKFYDEPDDEWTVLQIPMYITKRRREFVRELEAIVWTIEDGQVKTYQISKENIFEEQETEKWRVKKVALPQVLKGAVVEYRYRLFSPFIDLFNWEIQQDLPVAHSSYQFDIPELFSYMIEKQRVDTFDIEETGHSRIAEKWGSVVVPVSTYRWVKKQIPAFIEEPLITTPEDYVMKITFQLSEYQIPGYSKETFASTWPEFVKQKIDKGAYWSNYGKRMRKNELLPLIKNIPDDEVKAREIYKYVQSRVGSNGEIGVNPSKDLKDLLKSGEGNCADINIFLTNMLQAAGLTAYPVLLSTRDHGRVNEKYPFYDNFNYLLTYLEIGDYLYLLDASVALMPLGMISPMCKNGKGLVMKEQNPLWVDLDQGLSGKTTYFVNLFYQEDTQHFKAKVKVTYEGVQAVSNREFFIEDEASFKNKFNEGEIEDFQVSNLRDIDKAFKLSFKMEWPHTQAGDFIYLSPFAINKLAENPLQLEERTFDLDFNYQDFRAYYFTIGMPAGYELEESAQAIEQHAAENNIFYEVKVGGFEGISVEVAEKFHIKKSLISVDHYDAVKDLFDQILAQHAQQLVFKRK